ncbi:hypothetical protein AB0O58_07010 [Rhodococcus sp. NPDC080181]|uniref:hypothetical protein n=1 Tax=Rhodococcus sp. NPDC080181 TaxID=3155292 RepID=UPI00344FA88D
MNGGLGDLIGIGLYNARVAEAEFFTERPTREGIPIQLWRCLPNSPDSIVYVRTYVGPGIEPEMRPWRLGDLPPK